MENGEGYEHCDENKQRCAGANEDGGRGNFRAIPALPWPPDPECTLLRSLRVARGVEIRSTGRPIILGDVRRADEEVVGRGLTGGP
eukprot:479431-Pyramimonas_sp.AAC.1